MRDDCEERREDDEKGRQETKVEKDEISDLQVAKMSSRSTDLKNKKLAERNVYQRENSHASKQKGHTLILRRTSVIDINTV